MKEIRRNNSLTDEEIKDAIAMADPAYAHFSDFQIDRSVLPTDRSLPFYNPNSNLSGIAVQSVLKRRGIESRVMAYVQRDGKGTMVQAYIESSGQKPSFVTFRPLSLPIYIKRVQFEEYGDTVLVDTYPLRPKNTKKISLNSRLGRDIALDAITTIAPYTSDIEFHQCLDRLMRRSDFLLENGLALLKNYIDMPIVSIDRKALIKAFYAIDGNLTAPEARIESLKIAGPLFSSSRNLSEDVTLITLPTSVIIKDTSKQHTEPIEYHAQTQSNELGSFLGLVKKHNPVTGELDLFRVSYNIGGQPFALQKYSRNDKDGTIPVFGNDELLDAKQWEPIKVSLNESNSMDIVTAFAMNVWPAYIARFSSQLPRGPWDLPQRELPDRPEWTKKFDQIMGYEVKPEILFAMWCMSIHREIEKGR